MRTAPKSKAARASSRNVRPARPLPAPTFAVVAREPDVAVIDGGPMPRHTPPIVTAELPSLLSAAAHAGVISDVTIRCVSEQEVRERFEQMRHLAEYPSDMDAPRRRESCGYRWVGAIVRTVDCTITLATKMEWVTEVSRGE